MPQDSDCNNDVSYAIFGIGANLSSAVGRPSQTIRAAIDSLANQGLVADLISEFYETPCFPKGSGPDFVNAAFRAPTDLSVPEILLILHDVEARLGRQRQSRWGARTIDIDLIAMGDSVLPDVETYSKWKNLSLDEQKVQAPAEPILPHPRLQDRAFVLIPMLDIAPDWVHPVLKKSVREMADALPLGECDAVKRLKSS